MFRRSQFYRRRRGRLGYALAFLLALTAVSCAIAEDKKMIQIPFSPKEVGHCYEKLQNTEAVYRETIEEIHKTMDSAAPFEERLSKCMQVHNEMLEHTHQNIESEFPEEDIYLCCLYDMLEAMYSVEAKNISGSPLEKERKQEKLDALQQSIRQLPFGSPQFREGIRPRLERQVRAAEEELE